MAIPDVGTVLTKWKQNTSAASTRYVEGAQNTDKDPTALAIAAIPYMRTRINEAIDSGRVANGLRAAGKAGWLAGVTGKGAQNFATGVANADAKFQTAFSRLLAYESANIGRVNSMPNATPADRKNRMNTWFDIMSAYKTGA